MPRAAARGVPGGAGELEPGHHHDRPGARRRHLRRAPDSGDGGARSSRRSGRTRCCRRWAGRPASTWRSPWRRPGSWSASASRCWAPPSSRCGWGRTASSSRRRWTEIGLQAPKSRYVGSLTEAREAADEIGFPVIVRPSFTLGGEGGGVAYNRDEYDEVVRAALDASPAHRVLLEQSVVGWKEFELEVMRDVRGQRHRRLLGGERGRHGRAHRRLDHRGAAADPLRPRVPGDARRRLPGDPAGRGRHRRLEHPVRGRSGDRRPGGDRDEPPGLPQLGPGVEGHRLPDRQDRGPARRRLHPGRDPERHHRRDLRRLRADPRLHGGEDPALGVREVPRLAPEPRDLDEVGGRGDGDRLRPSPRRCSRASPRWSSTAPCSTGSAATPTRCACAERLGGAELGAPVLGLRGAAPGLDGGGGRRGSRTSIPGSCARSGRSSRWRRSSAAGTWTRCRRRSCARAKEPGLSDAGVARLLVCGAGRARPPSASGGACAGSSSGSTPAPPSSRP